MDYEWSFQSIELQIVSQFCSWNKEDKFVREGLTIKSLKTRAETAQTMAYSDI